MVLILCSNRKRRLTSEDAQDPSCDGDLGLGLVGGRADLDALETEQRDDQGAEPEQQRDDHQGPAGLNVTCTERSRNPGDSEDTINMWSSEGTRTRRTMNVEDKSLISIFLEFLFPDGLV